MATLAEPFSLPVTIFQRRRPGLGPGERIMDEKLSNQVHPSPTSPKCPSSFSPSLKAFQVHSVLLRRNQHARAQSLGPSSAPPTTLLVRW